MKGLGYAILFLALFVGCEDVRDNGGSSSGIVEPSNMLSTKEFGTENEQVSLYLANVTYSEKSQSLISRYAVESGYRMDWPAHFKFVSSLDSVEIKLYPYDNSLNKSLILHDLMPINVAQDVITNLPPRNSYIYELYSTHNPSVLLEKDTVELTGQLRMLKVYSSTNIRDIGGWSTKNGATVKYGKIFRGAAFSNMTPNDVLMIKDILKIGVEIDVRSNMELNLDNSDEEDNRDYSMFGTEIEYHHFPLPLSGYLNSHSVYADAFRVIVKALKSEKSVYIHCAGGADRTGVVLMLLESLLGVEYSDIAKDYELTSFAPFYYNGGNLRYCTRCNDILEYFSNIGRIGGNRYERIENFFKTEGVTEREIADFRRLMLDE